MKGRVSFYLLLFLFLFVSLSFLHRSYLGGVDDDFVFRFIEEAVSVPQTFTLAFVGDVLVHDLVYKQAKVFDGEYDFTPFFKNVKEDIQSADVAICHLETPISGKLGEYSGYPRFQIPHQIVDALSDAGFDGCSIASNHIADGGAQSVRETIRHFDRVGLKYAGAIGERGTVSPSLYHLNEKTIAHFSYTYGH